MNNWILLFQVFTTPSQYAMPMMIDNFDSQKLCQQAAESIKAQSQAVNMQCLPVQKKEVAE